MLYPDFYHDYLSISMSQSTPLMTPILPYDQTQDMALPSLMMLQQPNIDMLAGDASMMFGADDAVVMSPSSFMMMQPPVVHDDEDLAIELDDE